MPRTRIRRVVQADAAAPAGAFVELRLARRPFVVRWLEVYTPAGKRAKRPVERARRFHSVWRAFGFAENEAWRQRVELPWIVGLPARPDAFQFSGRRS